MHAKRIALAAGRVLYSQRIVATNIEPLPDSGRAAHGLSDTEMSTSRQRSDEPMIWSRRSEYASIDSGFRETEGSTPDEVDPSLGDYLQRLTKSIGPEEPCVPSSSLGGATMKIPSSFDGGIFMGYQGGDSALATPTTRPVRPAGATLQERLSSIDHAVQARARIWKFGCIAVKFAVTTTPIQQHTERGAA